tara:strand:+ start:771 stop:911 length:141 start_codon:yes stop_codon:yes gene_type:complete
MIRKKKRRKIIFFSSPKQPINTILEALELFPLENSKQVEGLSERFW